MPDLRFAPEPENPPDRQGPSDPAPLKQVIRRYYKKYLGFGGVETAHRKGLIYLNGVPCKGNPVVGASDTISVHMAPAKPLGGFDIVFVNDHLAIVDKDGGIVVEGGSSKDPDLLQRLSLATELQGSPDLSLVHRLDRNTAGLILVARTSWAREQLEKLFDRGTSLQKEYQALVLGYPEQRSANLVHRMVQRGSDYIALPSDGKTGKVAESFYYLEEGSERCSLVRVVLKTGRTHQIRSQLAAIGYPVLGDRRYGDNEANRRFSLKRQALVAASMEFAPELPSFLSDLAGQRFESRHSLDSLYQRIVTQEEN